MRDMDDGDAPAITTVMEEDDDDDDDDADNDME